MRRLAIVALVGAPLLLSAAPASADPTHFGPHNCMGYVVSGIAGPGFGQGMAQEAHDQEADNFGFADCGQTHRRNP